MHNVYNFLSKYIDKTMTLSRLSLEDRELAEQLLVELCDEDTLAGTLSEAGVYLGYQQEILSFRGIEKKQRLAQLVVLTLGDGLLRSKSILHALLRDKELPIPRSFKPGSSSAYQLTQELDLPEVFAGTQILSQRNPLERLEPILTIDPLLDYQQEVLEKAFPLLTNGERCLISIPTGGGKTRVATELLHRWHHKLSSSTASLWLAHTEELCEQAFQCISEIWRASGSCRPAVIYRAWGRHTKKLVHGEIYHGTHGTERSSTIDSIIVSTPQTALNLFGNQHKGSFGKQFKNISIAVIDEAHRAAAPTYLEVIRQLNKFSADTIPILGLSATPIRETYASNPYKGTEELFDLFSNLIEPLDTLGQDISPLDALRNRGVLAKLLIHNDPIRDDSPHTLSDYIQHQRLSHQDDSPALVFTQDVARSKMIAALLTERGLSSESIDSSSIPAERIYVIEQLRQGTVKILCNCELLTTGFDAPNVNQIFLARSTNSPVLYKQIIGRGLRGPIVGGNEFCHLYFCGVSFPFKDDPNTVEFARAIWSSPN